MDEIRTESTRKTFIVYDPNNGKIVHIHEVVALPGVSLPDDEHLESEARNIANKVKGTTATNLGILQVKREEMNPEIHYEVDTRNKTLLQKGKVEFKTQ